MITMTQIIEAGFKIVKPFIPWAIYYAAGMFIIIRITGRKARSKNRRKSTP